MEIAQEKRGAVSVLAPVGRLDTDSAADLELCVHDVLGTGVRHFVVDLAQINYVSSAGLRVLLMLAKSVDGKGSLRVSGLNPQVQQVFDIAGFTKLFAIHPDRESALRDHPAVGEPDPAPAPAPPARAERAERAERAPATPLPARTETPAAAVPAPAPAPVAPPRAAAPAEPPAPRASAPAEPVAAPAAPAPAPRAPVVPGVAEHAARLLGA
ncbi:MAG TPA: STAS domain-containing protein, partial [Xanthomonadales bacterium]|nr:STAS domain-containing protein [Xanthomonadales bacterium]